jgi:phosphate uptake regulator
MDFVDNIEKIGDHITNVAEGIIGGMRWRGSEKEAISDHSLTNKYEA